MPSTTIQPANAWPGRRKNLWGHSIDADVADSMNAVGRGLEFERRLGDPSFEASLRPRATTPAYVTPNLKPRFPQAAGTAPAGFETFTIGNFKREFLAQPNPWASLKPVSNGAIKKNSALHHLINQMEATDLHRFAGVSRWGNCLVVSFSGTANTVDGRPYSSAASFIATLDGSAYSVL